MSTTSHGLDPKLREYLQDTSRARESRVLARLREFTADMPDARMQISVEQGRMMAVLVRMLGARRTLEVGVFTGYSALCVAECLPSDGQLVACDVSEQWTSIARRFWIEAGVADRIDLRIGAAADTLGAMIDGGEAGSFDFAFVDADKEGYVGYYEQCLQLVRSGGVIAFDNAFLGGRVVNPTPPDAATTIMRQLIERVFRDDRVDPALVPIGDGFLMVRKR